MGETLGSGAPTVWVETPCWNAMSREQQESQVIRNYHEGEPAGDCTRMAEVAVQTKADLGPGPRLYCRPCAIRWLATGR